MYGTNDFEKSLSQAHQAMCLMVQRRCPATPQNFELWYNYVAGQNQSLIEQIDQAIGDKGILPQSCADRIYDDILSPLRGLNEAADITKKIGGSMDDVLSTIGSALDETSEYSRSLGSASQALGSALDDESLRLVVDKLVSSTQQMEARNRQLEDNLHASRQEIAELSTNLNAARNESRMDQLTGLFNRKGFDEMIRELTEDAAKKAGDLCLAIGDVDHFKKFNDTYGHQTGDQVLRLVAACLKSGLKGRDFTARYGGEEFAMLLPATDLAAAHIVVDELRKTVMSKKLVKKSTGEDLGVVTMSFGIALYRSGEPIEDLIHRADACLYAAKAGGRNLVLCETDSNTVENIRAA